MRNSFLKVAMGLAVASCALVSSAANADIFAKIDTIDGDSRVSGYEKQIEIQAMQFGIHHAGNAAAGGGAGAGKAAFTDVTLTKITDSASAKLMMASMTGEHLKSVVLVVAKTNGPGKPTEFVKVTLSEVLVTSYQLSSGGDRPTESISLNFASIKFEYKGQAPNGGPSSAPPVGWDLQRNQKI